MEWTDRYNDAVKFALQTRANSSSVSSNTSIRILKGDEGPNTVCSPTHTRILGIVTGTLTFTSSIRQLWLSVRWFRYCIVDVYFAVWLIDFFFQDYDMYCLSVIHFLQHKYLFILLFLNKQTWHVRKTVPSFSLFIQYMVELSVYCASNVCCDEYTRSYLVL
jgi:hypothetical protein